MLLGILAGLLTCALWGLTFVAPRLIDPYSALDLTVMRYGAFALGCLVLMIHPRLRPRGFSRPMWLIGLALGSVGYIGYFLAAAFAVLLAGAAIPPLIVGLMPVVLAVIANARDRSLPWSRLTLPLVLILIGVSVVNVDTLARTEPAELGALLLGILLSFVALSTWVAYGLINSVVMNGPNPPQSFHWTAVQGMGAGIGVLCLLPFATFPDLMAAGVEGTGRFVFWALLLGLAGSLMATWLWLIAATRMPLALAAQLIVAETVFGLAFGFLYEARLPTMWEAIGIVLQIAGVGLAIAIFNQARKLRLATEAIIASRNA
ncbi:MAG: DMT family transporter [Rhizobium sp.]|nr:DMT family transporter [Rhizobium sp.]